MKHNEENRIIKCPVCGKDSSIGGYMYMPVGQKKHKTSFVYSGCTGSVVVYCDRKVKKYNTEEHYKDYTRHFFKNAATCNKCKHTFWIRR